MCLGIDPLIRAADGAGDGGSSQPCPEPPAERLRELARLRHVRDRIDREYARPLDVEALARAAQPPAGNLSLEFRRAFGASPYAYLTRRRIEHTVGSDQESRSAVDASANCVIGMNMPTHSTRFAYADPAGNTARTQEVARDDRNRVRHPRGSRSRRRGDVLRGRLRPRPPARSTSWCCCWASRDQSTIRTVGLHERPRRDGRRRFSPARTAWREANERDGRWLV